MKTFRGGLIALSALIAFSASDTAAQDPVENRDQVAEQGRRGGPGNVGIETIMSMRERLELTEDQIASLDAVRRESVAARNAIQAEMAEMRSQLAAGQIRQSDMMAFMEDRRDAAPEVRDQYRERIEGILSEAQRESLADLRSRGRAFARGRASAGRAGAGRGARGFRGEARRGHRGQGWNRGGRAAQGQRGLRGQRGMRWRGFDGPGRRPGGDTPG